MSVRNQRAALKGWSPNSGTAIFQSINPDRTKVTATIEYEPEDLLEKTGDALGIPSGRAQADLERFRTFMEDRGGETGGWRGEIRNDETLIRAQWHKVGRELGNKQKIGWGSRDRKWETEKFGNSIVSSPAEDGQEKERVPSSLRRGYSTLDCSFQT